MCNCILYIIYQVYTADSKKNCHEIIEKHEVVDIRIKYT